MPASLHEWINHLNKQPLPAMALTAQHVSELMERPSTTNADYQRIVARDPGFALSIFRHLGNLPRPPREPITNIAHAVALAGMAPLEAGVNNLPLIKDRIDVKGKRGLLACYSQAVHAAQYLYQWAEFRRDPNADELMLGALLHNCGEMALWLQAPDQMSAIETQIKQGLSRESAFLAVYGFTHTQLSLGLAEAWALPPLICESVSPGGAFQPRPLGIMLACELARCSGSAWDSEQTMDLIELAAEYCQQTTDQAAANIHRVSAETARQLQGLHLPLSATELLHLQPESEKAQQSTELQINKTPVESLRNSDRITPADASLIRPSPSLADPDTPVPPTAKLLQQNPDPAIPAQIDSELFIEPDPEVIVREKIVADPRSNLSETRVGTGNQAAIAQPVVTKKPEIVVPKEIPTAEKALPQSSKPTAPETPQAPSQEHVAGSLQVQLTRVMKQLRDNAGLESAMFALITPDRKSIRAKFVICADKAASIKTFQVSLEKRNLFSILVSKPQSFWLNRGNRKKYLPAIPQYLRNSINTQGFFVNSVFVNDKAVGILYADSGNITKLNNGSFTYFKQLAEQLSKDLSNTGEKRATG